MVARQTLTLFVRGSNPSSAAKIHSPANRRESVFSFAQEEGFERARAECPSGGRADRALTRSAVVAREQIFFSFSRPIGGRVLCLLQRKQGLNGRVRGRPVRRTGPSPATRRPSTTWYANKAAPSPTGQQISVVLCARINRQTRAVLGPAKRGRDAHSLPPDEAAARRRRRPRTAPQAHTGRITALERRAAVCLRRFACIREKTYIIFPNR